MIPGIHDRNRLSVKTNGQEERRMDYRHLKYFMEVAEQKSFSKAARNLHISQSAISRMIKSLEEELGVTLFIMPNGASSFLNI